MQRLRENSDLVILPHRYGLCIYRADTARCQGDRAKVGVNTCTGCKNFVVGPRHLDYWRDRRRDLSTFSDSIPSALVTEERRTAITEEIRKADEIITLISGVPA